MQRDKYKAVWLRMLAVKEVRAARSANNLLKTQAKVFARTYSDDGEFALIRKVQNGLNDWAKVLVATYAVTIRDFVAFTNEQLANLQSKASFLDITQGFVAREALKKSQLITDTSVELVRKALIHGIANGLGETEIAKNIQNVIGGDAGISRAWTIARTETHNAATYAMQAAAEEIERPLVRIWVATEDERTRAAHAEADGQERGMDEPFDVGGELIDRPGEGSEANAINCRCVLKYDSPNYGGE